MERAPLEFQALLRAANPSADGAGFDLEATLSKARLRARVAGRAEAPSVRLGHFEVLRCLGRGGMGTVFEARDRRHGARLALKILQASPVTGWTEDALARLQREFRSLAHLSHPSLVAMYELHVQDGLPFFTMALIEGESLHELLHGDRPLGEASLRACLAQLVDALSVVHAHGLVHGDIKPSNILLAPEGKLTLLDFGVARAVDDPHGAGSSGTLRYMAPERLRGAAVDPAWDYYALGALLSEWLDHAASLQPSAAATVFAMSMRRLSRGLLEPDRKRRFAAEQIWTALDVPAPAARLGSQADLEAFVGRETELAALRGAFERAGRELVVCMVSGEPGIGKTALVQHALREAEREGALVLAGRCHQHEALPYKGLDGVIDALTAQLPQLSLSDDDTPALLRTLPRLPGLAAPEEARAMRRKAFGALASLLAACAERQRIAIFIDDLQWADDDAAALLDFLLGAAQPPPLLLIASRRTGEGGSCVSTLQAAMQRCVSVDLQLGPLDHAACRALAARAGAPSDALVTRLHGESGGNPLLLSALLRDPAAAQSGEPARSFHDLVRARMQTLEPQARELLALTALSGGPVSLRLLDAALAHAEHAWLPLATLRNARLLRTVDAAGDVRVLPHHDRVRDAVSSLLSVEARRESHARLLHAAKALALDEPEFCAEHAFRAGASGEAAHFAELAADRARQAMAFARARALYARALECRTPERPHALLLKLADAANSLGDLRTAAPLYLEASRTLTGDAASSLQLRAAELYLLGGAQEQALSLLQPTLRRAGIPLPGSIPAVGWLGLSSLCVAALMRPSARRTADNPPDERAEISFRLGYMLSVFEPARGIAMLLWSTARALRKGSPAQRGRALAQLAHVFGVLGWTSAASQDVMVEEATRLTRSDPSAHTHVLLATALLRFVRTEYRAALECLDAALPVIAVQAPDGLWFLQHVHAVVASVCVMTGDFTRIDTFAAAAEREAAGYANHSASSQLRCACSWRALARDDSEAMERYTREDRQRWDGARLNALYGLAVWAEGHRLLYIGAHTAAARHMALEAPRFARSAVSRARPWTTALTYLWGCIALANSEAPGDHHARSAAKLARRLERDSSACARGCAALLQAGLARRRGEHRAALEHYATAAAALTALGIRGHAAAAAYRSAELQSVRDPERTVPWFAEQAIANPARWVRAYAP